MVTSDSWLTARVNVIVMLAATRVGLNKTSFTVCAHGVPCRDFMRVRSRCRESISSFKIRLLFGACDSVMVVATHNRQEVCLPRVKLLSNGGEAVTL